MVLWVGSGKVNKAPDQQPLIEPASSLLSRGWGSAPEPVEIGTISPGPSDALELDSRLERTSRLGHSFSRVNVGRIEEADGLPAVVAQAATLPVLQRATSAEMDAALEEFVLLKTGILEQLDAQAEEDVPTETVVSAETAASAETASSVGISTDTASNVATAGAETLGERLEFFLQELVQLAEFVAGDPDHEVFRAAYGGMYDFADQLFSRLEMSPYQDLATPYLDAVLDRMRHATTGMNARIGNIPAYRDAPESMSKTSGWPDPDAWAERSQEQIFQYSVDDLGRTAHVEAYMHRRDLRRGSAVSKRVTKHLESQAEFRPTLDNGGHIVAREFGGSGGQLYNVVMQDKAMNQKMARLEDEIERQIRGRRQVRLTWKLSYYGDTQRPRRIRLTARFPDGFRLGGSFPNPSADSGEIVEYGPHAEDNGLKKLIHEMYKGARPDSDFDQIGDGSTAAIIAYELSTGQMPGRKPHTMKGRQMIKALGNWQADNPQACPADQALAVRLIRDLERALATKRQGSSS